MNNQSTYGRLKVNGRYGSGVAVKESVMPETHGLDSPVLDWRVWSSSGADLERFASPATKVALLTRRFPKFSETFIAGEVAALLDVGCNVEVLSMYRPAEAVSHGWMNDVRCNVTYLDESSWWRSFLEISRAVLRRPASLAALVRFVVAEPAQLGKLGATLLAIRSGRIGHLHAHYCSDPAALADAAAAMAGIPFSVSAHAKDIYVGDKVDIAGRLRRARFVTTCTRHNLDYLREIAADQTPIHLLYHGVDSAMFSPASEPPKAEPPLIVSVGRLKEKKGLDLLIGACSNLRDRGVNFECQIYGYGDQAGVLNALVRAHSLERQVSIRPPVSHDDLPGVLNSATAFVLPCRVTGNGDRDGIPNSVLEAMAAGIPVVSTRVSGLPEVVRSGHNGILVSPENTLELTEALQNLLDNRALCCELGRQARRTIVERFSWRVNIEPLAAMLSEGGAASDNLAEAKA